MKKSLSVIVVLFLFVVTAVRTDAVENKSESIGETSFYGSYEYEKEDQPTASGIGLYHSKYLNDGRVAGMVVLPRTGDYLPPIYEQIGFILLSGLSILIINEKKKKGYK